MTKRNTKQRICMFAEQKNNAIWNKKETNHISMSY